MCKESETKSKTVRDIPEFIESAGRTLVQKGLDAAGKPFQPYTQPRVADLSADQNTVFQKLRDMVAGSPIALPQATDATMDFMKAPAQHVSTERTVDEGGRLGGIADYVNPHIDAVLAPILSKIQGVADEQRKRLGASATSAGAFGDARHGIMEAGINADTTTAIGDATGKVYSDAFDKAMTARGGDLARFLGVDQANAGYGEAALGRKLTGANALFSQAGNEQERLLKGLQALLSGGQVQQSNEQAKLDAVFADFMRGQGNDANVINMLAAALRGAPYDFTQTTTNTQPDNSGLQLAGSVAAKVLPSVIAAI